MLAAILIQWFTVIVKLIATLIIYNISMIFETEDKDVESSESESDQEREESK